MTPEVPGHGEQSGLTLALEIDRDSLRIVESGGNTELTFKARSTPNWRGNRVWSIGVGGPGSGIPASELEGMRQVLSAIADAGRRAEYLQIAESILGNLNGNRRAFLGGLVQSYIAISDLSFLSNAISDYAAIRTGVDKSRLQAGVAALSQDNRLVLRAAADCIDAVGERSFSTKTYLTPSGEQLLAITNEDGDFEIVALPPEQSAPAKPGQGIVGPPRVLLRAVQEPAGSTWEQPSRKDLKVIMANSQFLCDKRGASQRPILPYQLDPSQYTRLRDQSLLRAQPANSCGLAMVCMFRRFRDFIETGRVPDFAIADALNVLSNSKFTYAGTKYPFIDPNHQIYIAAIPEAIEVFNPGYYDFVWLSPTLLATGTEPPRIPVSAIPDLTNKIRGVLDRAGLVIALGRESKRNPQVIGIHSVAISKAEPDGSFVISDPFSPSQSAVTRLPLEKFFDQSRYGLGFYGCVGALPKNLR